MPALLPVPGVLKLEFYGTQAGPTNWANVLHFHYTGIVPSEPALASMATTIDGLWTTNMTPLQGPDTYYGGVILTDLSSDDAAYSNLPDPTTGTRAGTMLAAQVAALVSYPSVTRFRGGHPRTYFCAGTNSDLETPGTWQGGFLSDLLAGVSELQGGIIGTGAAGTTIAGPCWVRYGPKLDRLPEPVVYDIVPDSFIALPRIATQRRRTGRRVSHA